MSKHCYKCGFDKEETEFYFKNSEKPELGRRAHCKDCQASYNQARREKADVGLQAFNRQQRELVKQDRYEDAKRAELSHCPQVDSATRPPVV